MVENAKLPRLRISRDKDWFGQLRNLEVVVGGDVIGLVPGNVTREFQIQVGSCFFFVRMDWYTSEARNFIAKPGAVYGYKVSPPAGLQQIITFLVLKPKTFFHLDVGPTNKDEFF